MSLACPAPAVSVLLPVCRPLGAVLVSVLLAAGPARAQSDVPATPEPLAHHQLGVQLGAGVVLVNANDDYYLPNEGVKFGSEAGVQYGYYFDKERTTGLRLGVQATGRLGNYTFGAQQVRRAETFLTVPLELVLRRPWRQHPQWLSTMALGGYFSELAQRYTYTLDPLSAKTRRTDDNWLYGIGGVTISYGIAYHRGSLYRELGLRFTTDLGGFTSSPGPADLPNLHAGNITVYYSVSRGR